MAGRKKVWPEEMIMSCDFICGANETKRYKAKKVSLWKGCI